MHSHSDSFELQPDVPPETPQCIVLDRFTFFNHFALENVSKMAQASQSAAQNLIKRAFQDLEQIATPNDARTFSNTTLEDVRKAARSIENEMQARQANCNMRRLEPFFTAMQHYSRPLEVLCNGTPYLPWIWAPVKLVLQITSDFRDLFKQIIDAYARIAETLPRFDRLSNAFMSNADFQQVLAVFYVDILRFHKEAYKLVKRNGTYSRADGNLVPAYGSNRMESLFQLYLGILAASIQRHSRRP